MKNTLSIAILSDCPSDSSLLMSLPLALLPGGDTAISPTFWLNPPKSCHTGLQILIEFPPPPYIASLVLPPATLLNLAR